MPVRHTAVEGTEARNRLLDYPSRPRGRLPSSPKDACREIGRLSRANGNYVAPRYARATRCRASTPRVRLPVLLDELLDIGLDRLAPDVVAPGAQVQVVRHDVARQPALGVQKSLADVLEEYGLAVVQLRDDGIDLCDRRAQPRRRDRPTPPLQIPDRGVQAFEVRLLLLQLLVDRLDAFGDLLQAPLGVGRATAGEHTQH